MSASKSVFYIEEEQRRILQEYQRKHGLKSPSEALREIINLHAQVEDQYELMALGNVLHDSLAQARQSLAKAFSEVQQTRDHWRGL